MPLDNKKREGEGTINVYSAQVRESAGRGSLATVSFRSARGSHTPPAWIVEPVEKSGEPPLIAIHGVTRAADVLAEQLVHGAGRTGRVVICPLFDSKTYSRYQRFEGKARSDQALLRLVDMLVDEGVLPAERFDLAGFSGGAQFAHRFTWLYPHRVGRLSIASAGWYTFPDDEPYPLGLGKSTSSGNCRAFCFRTNLTAFLEREIVVRVGALDTFVDATTRSGPDIDRQQGADRVTRARRWTAAIRQAAERLGTDTKVDFEILPGCGHDFTACVRLAGLDRVFLGEPARMAFPLTGDDPS